MSMETVLGILMGVGLSAACGFRIFIPLTIASLAAMTGHVELADGFEWLASPIALAAFSTATLLEVGAYYIPWLDHLLDILATPSAIIAGTLLTASFLPETSPFLRWTLAAIAGGGVAGVVQGGTVLVRSASGLNTGGVGNPIVSTAEALGSVATSILALVIPVLVVLLITAYLTYVWRRLSRRRMAAAA